MHEPELSFHNWYAPTANVYVCNYISFVSELKVVYSPNRIYLFFAISNIPQKTREKTEMERRDSQSNEISKWTQHKT